MVLYNESRVLSDEQKQKVLKRGEQRGLTCGSCGSIDFEVGQALYLGFLFLDEPHGNYMVALTCNNPSCESPRTGIKLHEFQFLRDE